MKFGSFFFYDQWCRWCLVYKSIWDAFAYEVNYSFILQLTFSLTCCCCIVFYCILWYFCCIFVFWLCSVLCFMLYSCPVLSSSLTSVLANGLKGHPITLLWSSVGVGIFARVHFLGVVASKILPNMHRVNSLMACDGRNNLLNILEVFLLSLYFSTWSEFVGWVLK